MCRKKLPELHEPLSLKAPDMQMRAELGTIYQAQTFTELYPRRGQPAEAPWRLALVTIMQFAEELSDRAADAGLNQQSCPWGEDTL